VVLERDPGLGSPPASSGDGRPAGSASFTWLGTSGARVEVRADRPAVVVVRNAWDPNWRATVDGRPEPVLAADGVVQGIAVPAGRHTIELRYHDPTIGWGMLAAALGLVVLLGGAVLLRRRARRAG
jgi:uncharacterized membrane protein YfhO